MSAGVVVGLAVAGLLAACLGLVILYLHGLAPARRPDGERPEPSGMAQQSSQPADGAAREPHEATASASAAGDRGPNVPSQRYAPDSQGESGTTRAPVSQEADTRITNESTADEEIQEEKSPEPQAQDQNGQDTIIQRAKQSIAYVKGKNSSGTGFVVRRGIIATNSHVIGNEYIEDLRVQYLSAERPDSKELKAKLLYEDRNRDIALLVLDGPEESPPPLVLAEIRELPKGHPIVLIGNPIKLNKETQEVNRVSEGMVDSLVVIDKKTWYHLKADAAPGNSGGPVLDAKSGQVLGILTLGNPDPLPDPSQYEVASPRAWPGRGRSKAAVSPRLRDSYCIPCQFLREAIRKTEDPHEPKRSPQEVAARHLAERIIWRIDDLHSLCQLVAKKEVEYLRVRRGDLVIGLNRDFIGAQDQIMKSLGPAIRAVRSNPALSPVVRQGVQKLLDNYDEVRKQTERTSARNELNYRKLLYKLSQNHASCLKQLSKELVVPEKE